MRTLNPICTPGTFGTMPGVHPPLAAPPLRPPVELGPSLACPPRAASERVLPALVSQG